MSKSFGTIPDLITPMLYKKYEKSFERLSLNAKKYLDKQFFRQRRILPKRYELKIRPNITIKEYK